MPPHGSPPHDGLPVAAAAAAAAWCGDVALDSTPVGGTGFSGGWVGRVRPRGADAWWVLKAFAPHTSRARAEWVHAFVGHLVGRGVTEVPAPRAALTGGTLVTDAVGVHWELVPFIAGVATEEPDHEQAAAALAALARVHVAAASLPGHAPQPGPSPGVIRRRQQATALVARPWSARPYPASGVGPFEAAVRDRCRQASGLLDTPSGRRAVAAVAGWPAEPLPLQTVLRDVWSDHVIFAAGAPAGVAGIVDVHAAGCDTPATDIARLAGSWRHLGGRTPTDILRGCPGPLAAYEAIRPLSNAERAVVPFLHAAGVICGLDNWFGWTLEEGRRFPDAAAVLARIDGLLDRLPAAVEWLAETKAAPRLTPGNSSL